MSETIEFESFKDLALAMGIWWPDKVSKEVQVLALKTLCDVPEVRTYLTSRHVIVRPPPGTFGYLVPRTHVFVNLGRCRDLRGDLVVAVAVYGMTQNESAAFIATSARKVVNCVKLLNDSEYEVVLALFDFSGGRPYSVGVEEALLQDRFLQAPFALNPILDELEKKDVVARVRPAALRLKF